MSTSGTLLIEAMLERLSAAQAKALLDQLDRSIAHNAGRFWPEQTGNRRRRGDSRAHDILENTTSHTSKDSLS